MIKLRFCCESWKLVSKNKELHGVVQYIIGFAYSLKLVNELVIVTLLVKEDYTKLLFTKQFIVNKARVYLVDQTHT